MKIEKRALIQYGLLYILIIMHGAVVWATKYALSFPALMGVGVLCALVIYKYKVVVPQKVILAGIALGILYCMSGVISGESLSHGFNFRTLIQIYLNFMIAYAIIGLDPKRSITRFVRIVFFFSVVSLVMFTLCNLGLVDFFKEHLTVTRYGESSRTFYGKYLYTILTGRFEQDGYTRNCGIYYEPGVHEIVINSALYILLFMRNRVLLKDKTVLRMIYVLIITLVTTKSTTGYLSLAVLLCAVIVRSEKTKLRIRILEIVGIIIGAIAIDYFVNGASSLLSQYVIQKLQGISINANYNHTSGAARIIQVQIAFQAMRENPLFGIGTARVEAMTESLFGLSGGTGNALFGMISTKGLLATGILLLMLFNPVMGNKNVSKLERWVFVFMVINVSFAQSQIAYPSFVLISVFYWFNRKWTKEVVSSL